MVHTIWTQSQSLQKFAVQLQFWNANNLLLKNEITVYSFKARWRFSVIISRKASSDKWQSVNICVSYVNIFLCQQFFPIFKILKFQKAKLLELDRRLSYGSLPKWKYTFWSTGYFSVNMKNLSTSVNSKFGLPKSQISKNQVASTALRG